MTTKRQAIIQFRKRVQERTADSTYTDQDLYQTLMEHAPWLIKREISSGRIYRNTVFFQTLRAMDVEEVSTVPSCVKIRTNCKIYRTKYELPEMWLDNDGPVIKTVSSVDNSTYFSIISPTQWQNKINDPYQKFSSEKYCFFADGYLWFPQHNPHLVNISGYYKDDLRLTERKCSECGDSNKDCIKFLDTEFMVPEWVIAELFQKALESLFPSKQLPEDTQIDKNPNNKN